MTPWGAVCFLLLLAVLGGCVLRLTHNLAKRRDAEQDAESAVFVSAPYRRELLRQTESDPFPASHIATRRTR